MAGSFALDLFRMNDDKAAARAAFAAGRFKHGRSWKGEHPLLEAFVELLDYRNYLDEAWRWGDLESGEYEHLRSLGEIGLRDTRAAINRLEATKRDALSRRRQLPGGSVGNDDTFF